MPELFDIVGHQIPVQDPLKAQLAVQNARNQQQQNAYALQASQMGLQGQQLDLQQKQQAADQQKQVITALSQSGGDTDKAIGILKQLGNPQWMVLDKHKLEVDKEHQAILKTQGEIQTTALKNQADRLGHIASLTGDIESLPEPVQATAYAARRQLAIANGYATPDQLPPEWNPQTAQIVNGLKQNAISAKDQIDQKLEANKANETATHDRATEQQGAATLAQTATRDANTAKHDRVLEEVERRNAQTQAAGLVLRRDQAQGQTVTMENGQTNPLIESVAQRIAAGKQAVLNGFALTKPLGAAIMQRAGQINPNLSAGDFENYKRTVDDFSSAGRSGQQAVALNTLVRHSADLKQLIPQLGNSSFTPANAAFQKLQQITGGDAPTNFDQLKQYVAGETVKLIRGGGGSVEDERNASANILRSASPQQLSGALDTNFKVAAGKMQALNEAARKGKLGDDYNVLDQGAQKLVEQQGYDPRTLDKKTAPLPSGGGRTIDKATAKSFYDAAGGDPKKAQALAEKQGWKVQ